MPFDVDRYNRLRESAVLNQEALRGSYQDQSRNRLAMTAGPGIGWTQINGIPAIVREADAGPVISSGVIAQIVDATASFACEAIIKPTIYTTDVAFMISQTAAGGSGLWFYWQNDYVRVRLLNSAGAAFVTFSTPNASVPPNHVRHVIVNSVSGGTSTSGFVNGVPVKMTTLAGAGALAAFSGPLLSMSNRSYISALCIRVYPFALTNADAQALYGAARALTGGEV